jgi:hypothetical protein
MKDRAGAYCFRFMPKEEKATLADKRFVKGPMTITTFAESRPKNDDGTDATLPSPKEKENFGLNFR